MKSAIIVGGGKSVRDGIEKGLWDKIKGKDVWSINYAFMTMPFLPNREVFVDRCFYRNNIDALQTLAEQKVLLYARYQDVYAAIDEIKKFQTTKEKTGYRGKQTLKQDGTPHVYVGTLGLAGTFALSLAIAEDYDTIYLLGYDFGVTTFADKDTHYYQGKLKVISTGVGNPHIYVRKDDSVSENVKDYEVFAQEKDVTIYNISPNSRIPYFTKIDYDQFFELIGDKHV